MAIPPLVARWSSFNPSYCLTVWGQLADEIRFWTRAAEMEQRALRRMAQFFGHPLRRAPCKRFSLSAQRAGSGARWHAS